MAGTHQDFVVETSKRIDGLIRRWCPEFSRLNETKEMQLMRVMLQLNAYEMDASRVLLGQSPIRTDYPLPLPTPPPTKLIEAAKQAVTALTSGEDRVLASVRLIEGLNVLHNSPALEVTQRRELRTWLHEHGVGE